MITAGMKKQMIEKYILKQLYKIKLKLFIQEATGLFLTVKWG